MTSIINTCFTTETFPTPWKMAEVIPILKSGDHEKANNNRPISLLPILSKICEKAALNQFLPYLVSNDCLTTKQSGNKRFHSTETALIHTTDFILNAMDKKKTTAIVLLDMSKAFDSINHRILLNKLQDVGASNSALQWFHSYLSNRSQIVRIHSVLSDPLPMVNGVPQGSILGPILFSIYINNLPKIPRSCSTDCYVDDTKLYMCFPVQDYQSAITEINNDLIKVRNWCCDNLLLLNPNKTELILYGSRQIISKLPDFQLSLLGKKLIPAQTVKDLGVTFDKNFNFNEHILKTVSSCMSSLGQISRVKHVLKKELLVTVINSLVFSKLYYCSVVWSSITDRNVRKLQGIQNFAARIISGTRKYDHITPVLKELHIPLLKTASGHKTFYFRAVKLWNDLCPELKLSMTIQDFKRKLKRILFKQFLSEGM